MALSHPVVVQVREPMAAGPPRWRRYAIGYGLVAPALLVVFGLFAYPLAYELQLSFTNTRSTSGAGSFVGLQNYARILTNDTFWEAVRNTAFLVGVTAAAELLLGLAVALLLWRRGWLWVVLFAVAFLPWIYPSSFANYTWYWMLLPPFHTFYSLGAIQARFWLEGIFGEQAWQVASFTLVCVWRGSSVLAIVLLAGFRAIPQDLLEYARLDINNPFRYFWSIVLPLSRRFIALAAVVGLTVAYIEYLAMYIESNGRITIPVIGTLVFRADMMDDLTGYAAALSILELPVVVLLVLVAVPLIEAQVSRRALREDDTFAFLFPTSASGPVREPPTSEVRPTRNTGRRALWKPLGAIACVGLAAFYLLPIYYTAVQSVKSQADFREGPIGQPFWAFHLDFQDGWLDTILDNPVFWRSALVTLIVFGTVVVVGVAIALLAGYALARMRLPAAEWLARVLFATYFVPQVALVVPLLQVYSSVGLENTLTGIILIYLTMAVPFATWLFFIYFQMLDAEAEEHALLDGSRLRVFASVVLPRAWPVIAAAAVFAIGMMSSDLLYARVFTLNGATRTLPVTMGSMVYDPDIWADANAAIIAGAIPLLLVGIALGRTYLKGLAVAFGEEE